MRTVPQTSQHNRARVDPSHHQHPHSRMLVDARCGIEPTGPRELRALSPPRALEESARKVLDADTQRMTHVQYSGRAALTARDTEYHHHASATSPNEFVSSYGRRMNIPYHPFD